MNQQIIDDLKSIDWQTIIDYCNSLDDLNESQWRFLKGLVVELVTEKKSKTDLDPQGLTYVGEKHKDYIWSKYNISAEMKSQLSGSMYGVKGGIKKNFTIKLNNSHGTNKQSVLPLSDVADVLIVLCNNGAFILDKSTIMAHATPGGDGWEVKVSKDQVIEISGHIKQKTKFTSNLKQVVQDAIKQAISSL